MRVNVKLIQLFGDALIPLLGFFWWGWSLYFIILFYLIDYLSNEIFLHVKSRKIVTYQKINNSKWLYKGLLSATLLLGSYIMIHFAMRTIHPDINFIKEMVKFWKYKDFGIEQGYILLPLIALVGFQRYKMEFIMLNKFKSITLDGLWNPTLRAHFIVLGGAAFIIGLSTFVVFSETVYILGIVAVSSAYQLLGTKA